MATRTAATVPVCVRAVLALVATTVPVTAKSVGELDARIDALGTRAYRLRPKKAWRAASEPPAPALDPANVLGNPSFEDGANLFPDGFWTMVGNDTGTCSSSFSSSSEI